MQTCLISVIVPVYNIEQYIDECVTSIVNQSYSNLQIILVDDGSPDNCPQICDKWASKDSRIRVIHKQNGGLSDARNAGLEIASGELIAFVDGDDYIHTNMLRMLYENMIENKSDISACGVQMFWCDGKTAMLTPKFNGVLNTEQALSAIINEYPIKQPVWYKLYKADLVKGLLFPVGKQHEDVFWSYLAISKAGKVSVFDTPMYFYRQRDDSIMGAQFSLKSLDSLEAKLLRNDYIKLNFPSLFQESNTNLWFSCIYALQMSYVHIKGESCDIANNKIIDIVNSLETPKITHIKGIKQKIWFLMSKFSFVGTCKLRNKLGIGF